MGEPGGLPSMGSQSRTRLKRLSCSSSSNWDESVGVGNRTVSMSVTYSQGPLSLLLFCVCKGHKAQGLKQARFGQSPAEFCQ